MIARLSLMQILGQTKELVAVGKPASMPVHVSGQYRKNTLLSIVETEHPELGGLFPIHRLDKNVSGVLLFARSKEAAEKMRHLIQVPFLSPPAEGQAWILTAMMSFGAFKIIHQARHQRLSQDYNAILYLISEDLPTE